MRVILILSVIGILFSCNETHNNKNVNAIQSSAVNVEHLELPKDFSSAIIKIERGAFHYDKFILKDTTITYHPSSDKYDKQYDVYNHVSEQKISKSTRDSLIAYIVDNGIFDLKDSYACTSTCTSQLVVTFEYDGRTKKITSEDFKRNCPKLLIYIESEIVKLHRKNLKRVFLPG